MAKGQAWCSGESCLTESPGHRFEAASLQILRGEGLPRFFPSPDPTHVGASGSGSAPFIYIQMADESFSELFPPLHGNCYVLLGSSASLPVKVGWNTLQNFFCYMQLLESVNFSLLNFSFCPLVVECLGWVQQRYVVRVPAQLCVTSNHAVMVSSRSKVT